MTKKKLIIAGLLSVAAVGGIGATAHAFMDHKGPMRADTNGDGVVSRSEFFAAAEARFKRKDANSDRVLAGTELQDKRGRFARLDANNDGKLSFAEQAAGTTALFARLDANGDGKLTPEELGPGRRHGRHGGDRAGLVQGPDRVAGPGGGMMLGRVDTNGDGKITREEMRAQADQRFDRLDANKDGVIDQAEMQAVAGRMGQRGMGRGAWRNQGMNDMPPPPPPAPEQK